MRKFLWQGAHKNRSLLQRSREILSNSHTWLHGTCQFAPILHMCFHLGPCIELVASTRSPTSPRKRVRATGLLRANSAGFRTISISQTNRGHLRGLAYQVARNSRISRRDSGAAGKISWTCNVRAAKLIANYHDCLVRAILRSASEYTPLGAFEQSAPTSKISSQATNCTGHRMAFSKKKLWGAIFQFSLASIREICFLTMEIKLPGKKGTV